jgi:aspartyl-tRNA synthetase
MEDAPLKKPRAWKRTIYGGLIRPENEGQEVTLLGWVQRSRDMGHLLFVDLRDREGLAQVVFSPERPDLLEAATPAGYVVGIRALSAKRAPGGHQGDGH